MGIWRQRRRSSTVRRNVVAMGVVLALVAAVVPPATRLAGEPQLTAGVPGDGVVDVPAHPEGASFNPNQLKGIEAADPASKINLIQPPTAGDTGDARLGYPIEVPPGRGGAQPSVALTYNSSAKNSWTGVGWNVTTQSITIDTRWGVPRYHGGLETETYLLKASSSRRSRIAPNCRRAPRRKCSTRGSRDRSAESSDMGTTRVTTGGK